MFAFVSRNVIIVKSAQLNWAWLRVFFGLRKRLILLGQHKLNDEYLTQCMASMVMLVKIDFEVRKGPSLAH